MTPLEAAKLAAQAYDVAPVIGKQDDAARAIVVGSAVAFPGSNNIACWLADLQAFAHWVDGLGQLHAGIWDAFEEIQADLLKLSPDYTVGHSEGAALALIYAGALCLAGKPPKAVYAFEPPRIAADDVLGDLLKAHGVALHLTRNGDDIVPLVPRLLHDWRHPGPLIQIGHAPTPNLADDITDHKIANVIQSEAARAAA